MHTLFNYMTKYLFLDIIIKCVYLYILLFLQVGHEDVPLPLPEVDQTSDQFELQTSEDTPFVSNLSSEYASVMFHDYCGPVSSNFSHNLNKNEQTCTFSATSINSSTQTPSTSIPKMTSVYTQTCSIPLVDITELAKSGIMRKDMKSIGILLLV
jgi:hypothetical protein